MRLAVNWNVAQCCKKVDERRQKLQERGESVPKIAEKWGIDARMVAIVVIRRIRNWWRRKWCFWLPFDIVYRGGIGSFCSNA